MRFVFPFVVVVHWWIRFLRSFPFLTNRQRDRLISISRLTFPISISAREEESGHGSLDIQLHFHSFRVWYLSVRLSLSYRQHYAENLHFFCVSCPNSKPFIILTSCVFYFVFWNAKQSSLFSIFFSSLSYFFQLQNHVLLYFDLFSWTLSSHLCFRFFSLSGISSN